MIYLSFVKLYFSSTSNYIQFSHINLKFLPFLQHLTDDFQIGNSMRFFKNASKTQYSGRKKVILRRRAKKNVSPFTLAKKWRRSPKKINWSISNAPEFKRVSHLCFNSKHADATFSVT